MKCVKCQFENLDGMNFCGKCGAKLEKLCPQCHFSNPVQYEFCGKCGQKLGKPTHTRSIDFSQPQTYTPKHLADKILTTRTSIEGERKLVTIMFADVANFTGLSEKLDPEEVHEIMDGCMRLLTSEIHRYDGRINQFVGDGVMALFGAPAAQEDHAQRACHAAMAIQRAMDAYGRKIQQDYGVTFQLRDILTAGFRHRRYLDLRHQVFDQLVVGSRVQFTPENPSGTGGSDFHHLAPQRLLGAVDFLLE